MGVALYLQEDTFLSTVVQDLEQQARVREEALGVKLNFNIADARSSQASQNEQVDRFLQQEYDVICVNLVDRTAAAVIVDKAQAAGVPIVFFNRQPVEEDLDRWDQAYYVAPRRTGPGSSRADRAGGMEKEPAALDRNGDGILQYVMLEGEPGHQDALLRTEYCVKTLVDAGVAVEKLDSNNADWSGVRPHCDAAVAGDLRRRDRDGLRQQRRHGPGRHRRLPFRRADGGGAALHRGGGRHAPALEAVPMER